MTAMLAAIEAPSWPVADVDLLYPDQQDPIGREYGGFFGKDRIGITVAADPFWYVVWVDIGRPHQRGRDHHIARSLPELAPRKALHVGLLPSPGLHDCNGHRS